MNNYTKNLILFFFLLLFFVGGIPSLKDSGLLRTSVVNASGGAPGVGCGGACNGANGVNVDIGSRIAIPANLVGQQIQVTYTLTAKNDSTNSKSNTSNTSPGLSSITYDFNNNVQGPGIASSGPGVLLNGQIPNVQPGDYILSSQDIYGVPDPGGKRNITIPGGGDYRTSLDGNLTDQGSKDVAVLATKTSQGALDPCEGSTFKMSWAICPTAEAMASGVALIQGWISEELNIPVNVYFDNTCTPSSGVDCTTNKTNYTIWANMRNLSLSLLVIVALIMVIATALDVGPFDAYTVKKMLPKIVIAVIAITFSWQIGRLLVQFSDDLGAGVSQLIYSAAGVSSSQVLAGIGSGVFAWLGIGGAAAVGATVLGLGTVGPLAMLMLLLPLIIGILLAFLALILRRLIVIVCVVFAPIAFVAYIFPGGQKLWKLWKDSFIGALFVYPMITGLIALGGVLAYLTDNNSQSGAGPVKPLISLILFIAPFFLIPKLFKMSMGALGMVSGAMSNAKQSWNKGLSRQRKEMWAGRRERSKAGGLYTGRNALSRRLGAIGVGVGTGGRGRFGVGAQGRAATSNARLAAADDKMKDPKFVNATFNDGVRKALMYGSDKAADDAGVSKADRVAAAAVGYSAQNQLGALKAEQTNKGRNFKNAEEASRVISMIADANGVNETALMESASYGFRTSGGRGDLGALKSMKGLTGRDREIASAQQTVAGFNKIGLQDHGKGSAKAIENMAEATRLLGGKDFVKFQAEAKEISRYGSGDVSDAAAKATRDSQNIQKMENMEKFGRDIKPDGTVEILEDSKGNAGLIPLKDTDGKVVKDASGNIQYSETSYFVQEVREDARSWSADPRLTGGAAAPPDPFDAAPPH